MIISCLYRAEKTEVLSDDLLQVSEAGLCVWNNIDVCVFISECVCVCVFTGGEASGTS